MNSHVLGLVLWATLVWAGLSPKSFAQSTPEGHWVGTMTFKTQSCPIEIEITRGEEKASASLSLPALGYFDQPRPFQFRETTSLEIDLPFGLGLTNLTWSESSLEGVKSLGNDTLSLKLQRTPAEAVASKPKEYEFKNGEIKFAGWLFPAMRQPAIGTVLVLHGSSQGGIDSWTYRGWAELLSRQGYRVFLYNKRSEENGRNLTDLASDAEAALAFLRELDPDRSIGILGGSQAGWLAAFLAAEHPEEVAFVAVSGWPAVTPREQELQRIAHELLSEGNSQVEIEAAIAYANFYFYVANHRELWPRLQEATQFALQQKWGGTVETPQAPEDLDWWQANQSFPTWDHLARIRCPVFAAWGERDNTVPPAANAELLKRLISKSDNSNVTISVYPEADHRIELSTKDSNGNFRWPQLAPNFLKDLEGWLKQQSFH